MPLSERRLGNPGRIEHRRRDVDQMTEVGADLSPLAEAARPVHDRSVAGAAPMRGDLLHPLIRRVHGVRPANREVVQRLRGAELVDSLGHELRRLDRRRPVERDHPVKRAIRPALARPTVIARDVDDQRVVEDPETLERVDHPPDLIVGVLHVAGVDFHLPREHRLQFLRHVLPRLDLLRSDGQLSIRGDHAHLLLAGEDLLAQRVPALIELPPVLVRPFLVHGVRCVRATRGEVHKERLVRHQRLLLLHPFDRVGGDVIVEVVALLRRLRRLDRRGALIQVRPVVVGLRAEEPIEVLKPAAGRPAVKRPHLARLPHRHLVALADMSGRVAIERQDLRQRRGRVRPDRVIPRRRGRPLGDRAHPHRMMVAAAQQTCATRRAQSAHVEPVVGQAARRQTIGRRRRARTSERVHRREPRIVEHDQKHVRRALGRPQRLDRRKARLRILRIERDQPRERAIRDR